MGVIRAGFHGTVGQPSAQVIDGSLKFDRSKNFYLTRTPSIVGNRKTFTYSCWFRKLSENLEQNLFSVKDGDDNAPGTRRDAIRFESTNTLKMFIDNSADAAFDTYDYFRDNGWYHIVVAVDTTLSTESDRVKIYKNGEQFGLLRPFQSYGYPNQNTDCDINTLNLHTIGSDAENAPNHVFDGNMSQVYFIDGQQLDATYFGFTDPLTNTWRPKKFDIGKTPSGSWGTNGFYLPMDGNSPIGEDKSGNGNDWTPVNFGGSNTIEKSTGAFPILNTVNGGNVATVGVRTDASVGVGSCVLALPLSTNATDVSNQIDGRSSQKSPSVTGAGFATTESNFYGSSAYFDGPTDGNVTATNYITVPDSNGDFVIGTGDYTMEAWVWGNDWTPGTANEEQGIMGHDGAPGSEWIGFWSATGGLFGFYNAGPFVPSASPTDTRPTLVNEKWYHMAATRESGTVRCFLDGVLLGSQSSDTTDIGTGTVCVGIKEPGAGNQFNGYIQDARLYVGVAKYTESFIPTSTNPDILPDTPSGVSGSSKLTKVTDGAVYFDGSGDYLTIPWSSDFDLGLDSDFTIEFFVNFQDDATQSTLLSWGADTDNRFDIGCQSANQLRMFANSGGNTIILGSTSISTKKWHHVAVVGYSDYNGFGNSVLVLYLDGVREFQNFGALDTYAMPTDASNGIDIGRRRYASSVTDYFGGYISNLRIVKGSAIYPYQMNITVPTEPLTNVTNTKLLCCQSVGITTSAAVSPGSITANGDAVSTNFTPFNTDINTVRGQETSYCTLNPLNSHTTFTLSNGNLEYSQTTGGVSVGTIGVSSGKWYWEYIPTSSYSLPGLYQSGDLGMNYLGTSGSTLGFTGGAFADASGGPSRVSNITFTIGDIIGFVLDMDAGTLTIYKNGIASSLVFSNLTGTWFPAHGANAASTGIFNFGQKPFKYTPPDGFQPLNATNIRPETVITRPDQYVGVTTYPGDSSQTQLIKLNMQPDLVWIKSRFVDSANHILVDSVRGDGQELFSNTDQNEGAPGNSVEIKSNGFTVPGVLDNRLNGTNRDYVAWAWKAGGNKNTFNVDDVGYATAAAAGLDGGTITPTGASVGTKQGFSIISYTGIGGTNDETISHGLSQSPDMVIIKNRHLNTHIDWAVAHTGTDDNRELHLNTNEIPINVGFLGLYKSNFTSTTFAVNASANVSDFVNASNQFYIAYVWHNVPGLQKFGRYEGNGNTNGTYVELGFKPAILWLKNIDSDEHWYVYDSVRSSYNPAYQSLMLSNDIIEENGTNQTRIDLLSSGFKLRQSNNPNNANTYIYAAWAESPSINLYGAQSNGR